MSNWTRQLAVAVALTVLAILAAPQSRAQMDSAVSAGPSVSLEAVPATNGMRPGETVQLAVVVDVEEGWHVNAHKPRDPYLIPTVLELALPEGFAVGRMAYPAPVMYEVEGFPEKLAVYGGQFVIGAELRTDPDAKPDAYTISLTLRYQACNDRQCMMPTQVKGAAAIKVVEPGAQISPQRPELFAGLNFDGEAPPPATAEPAAQETQFETAGWRELIEDFEVAGSAGGYLPAGDFIEFLDRIEQGVAEPGLFEDKALWLVVVLVVVGGLLLNFTPCVLPLIPVNLAIIGAGAKAGSKSRGFMLGAVYGLGMAAAYGVLGLVVILGVSSTFGALNATVWFNTAIAVVFVLLALAMFEVFMIDFSRLQGRLSLSRMKGGTFLAAGTMGVVAALLAGACVAPVILSTVVYAQNQYARGNELALTLPFLIGLGMGLPWPFAGAGLSFLPKPGKWMQRVRYAFGVIILLLAAYYAHIAWTLYGNANSRANEEGWHTELAPALVEAKQEQKPVFIDFWATWCKNCLLMDETTFNEQNVRERLDQYVKVKFQAEHPDDPHTREIMKKFDVVGLPTYVVLKPKIE